MTTIIVIGWLLCSAAAFWLFQRAWRQTWDLTIADAVPCAILSLWGPFSLFIAAVTALDTYLSGDSAQRVILPRRKL